MIIKPFNFTSFLKELHLNDYGELLLVWEMKKLFWSFLLLPAVQTRSKNTSDSMRSELHPMKNQSERSLPRHIPRLASPVSRRPTPRLVLYESAAPPTQSNRKLLSRPFSSAPLPKAVGVPIINLIELRCKARNALEHSLAGLGVVKNYK